MTTSTYQIKGDHITTPWAKKIDPELPHPEYPRPQLIREGWQNLNGLWDYSITPKTSDPPTTYKEKILVPFPLESALSGVQRKLSPDELLWYRRSLNVNPTWKNGRVILHFGAVDWSCQVFLNGEFIGKHVGGFTPFSFELTEKLANAENELVITVWDPTDSKPIQRGKQVRKPGFIWYSQAAGIWQTVWLEHVPQNYIAGIAIVPDIDNNLISLKCQMDRQKLGQTIRAVITAEGEIIAEELVNADEQISMEIPDPKLWSPSSPFLYDLELSLIEDGTAIDKVQSYFGMRKFSLDRDSNGIPRFCLNNEPLFLYGPLDQGYWPDGLLTPPSDEAVQWEINLLKKAGFNLIRKHIKVEAARYYAHCDRVGMIVWQDMVSGGISPKPSWFIFTKLFRRLHDDRCYWRLGRRDPENRQQFRSEYQEMIDALFNVVSIGVWCPFNEGWGQFDAAKIAAWTQSYDPTRLVDHASGWFDQGAGHFKSEHVYFKTLPKPPIDPDRALALSEFGGYNLRIADHVWDPEKNFGYKKFSDQDSLTEGYCRLLKEELIPWIQAGLSAAVYTQTTDIETEVNGLLTYDRKIIKMNLKKIQEMHQKIFSESKKTIQDASKI